MTESFAVCCSGSRRDQCCLPADRGEFPSPGSTRSSSSPPAAALGGIVWDAVSDAHTLSVPALTGAIMCMGVATATAFWSSASRASAWTRAMTPPMPPCRGVTRFRPVLMTALADDHRHVPMALGIGEGGEQTAPLGRAVIGDWSSRRWYTVLRAHRLHPHPRRRSRDVRPVVTRAAPGVMHSLSRWSWRMGHREPVSCPRHPRREAAEPRLPPSRRRSRAGVRPPAPGAAGNVQAYYEAPIYARTSGYLKVWHTDIGTTVRKASARRDRHPEVDQQLRQAQAIWRRAGQLRARPTTTSAGKVCSRRSRCRQQDADQRPGMRRQPRRGNRPPPTSHACGSWSPSSGRGALQRRGSPNATPMSRIDQRRAEPGSALFRVADTHRLRIYVSVPQAYAGPFSGMGGAGIRGSSRRALLRSVASTARALDARPARCRSSCRSTMLR